VFVPLWQPASDIFLYACAYFEANKYDDDDDDDSDLVSFHIYASWLSPPSCG